MIITCSVMILLTYVQIHVYWLLCIQCSSFSTVSVDDNSSICLWIWACPLGQRKKVLGYREILKNCWQLVKLSLIRKTKNFFFRPYVATQSLIHMKWLLVTSVLPHLKNSFQLIRMIPFALNIMTKTMLPVHHIRISHSQLTKNNQFRYSLCCPEIDLF